MARRKRSHKKHRLPPRKKNGQFRRRKQIHNTFLQSAPGRVNHGRSRIGGHRSKHFPEPGFCRTGEKHTSIEVPQVGVALGRPYRGRIVVYPNDTRHTRNRGCE